MSIYNGFIDKDQLNSAFISKKATGTQILAGSLRILGNINLNGELISGDITARTLTAAGTITAMGNISASTFSGSGASLTNLPAENLTGNIADARLSSNVMMLNKAQTVSAHMTFNANSHLYFAGGSAYYVSSIGQARFNSLTTTGDVLSKGNIYAESRTTLRGNGNINILSHLSGRTINRNPDFISGDTTGYTVYDNANSGKVSMAIVTDNVAPNSTGKILRISYNPALGTVASTPGWGGVLANHIRSVDRMSTWSYRAGTRLLIRIIAKIPTGRTISLRTNATGDGGGTRIVSPVAGTGQWNEYLFEQTIAETGTFSNIGFVCLEGGADTAFTWDISLFQIIGIDELPDTDRASSLNVGYKQIAPGWGEVHATGKIESDTSIITGGSFILSNAMPIKSNSGESYFYPVDASGNMHVKANEGNKTVYMDAETFHFRNIAGSSRIVISSNGAINLNENIIASKDITVDGKIVINKDTSNNSRLEFKAQTNDTGYIEHTETNNVSRMYFAVGDENNDTDYFAFGVPTAKENAKITAAGNATFKSTSVTTLAASGQVTITGDLILPTTSNNASAIKLGNVSIGQGTANSSEMIITNLSQLRFGSATGWAWNNWAGVKYDTTNTKLIIGGPASSVFTSTASNIPRIDVSFEGTNTSSFDGMINIKRSGSPTISAVDLENSWLLLGTATEGMGFDSNEIFVGGAHGHFGTIGAYNLYFKTNGAERMSVHQTGAKITGAFEVTSTTTIGGRLTASDGISIPSNGNIYIGTYGDPNSSFRMHYNGSNSFLDFAGSLTVRSGTTARFTLAAGGNVGMGVAPHATYKLDVAGDIHGTGWYRVTGNGGYYWQTHGGGVYMTDSSWVRVYGSKGFYVPNNTLRADGTLQVGSSDGLVVTGSTSLNWKAGTIFSGTSGKVSINDTTNSEHPLHVKTAGSYMGINIKRTADTDITGFSIQNADGKHAAYISSNGTANSDLVFWGGTANTNLTSLTENLRIHSGGNMVLRGNFKASGASGDTSAPTVHLAARTGNTGVHSPTAGEVSLYANGTEVLRSSSSTVTLKKPTLVESNLSINSNENIGLRFWNSDAYRIHMGTRATHGGVTWVQNDDYNMYFQMTTTNRGFAFKNTSQGGVTAQIEGNGRVNSVKGFRANKFEMAYNAVEDSLDFIYHG